MPLRIKRELFARFRSPPVTVTPSRVPLEKLKVDPCVSAIVPPLIVPDNFQLPVVLSRVRVLEALFSVPVMLTVPAEPLTVPRLAVVKLPPRFTVLPAPAVMVPALDQLVALIV